MTTHKLDYFNSPMPEGYERWECNECTAQCNYEAMTQCVRRHNPFAECGFDRDQPESNNGHFAFIKKVDLTSE